MGVFEQAIAGSELSGSDMCENRRPGILWARGARENFENMIFFLKQNTREESRRSGTGWVFLSKKLWVAGVQGAICVKTEDQGLGGC